MSGKYAVKEFIEPMKAVSDLQINEHNLDLSMMTHAGLFAFYAAQAAKAQYQLDQLEQMQDIVFARLDQKVRDAATSGGKKLTEAVVKALISLEPDAIAISTSVNKARMIVNVCKAQAEAFRQRKDMLVSMAINNREEKKGEVRVYGDEKAQLAREARNDRVADFRERLRTE